MSYSVQSTTLESKMRVNAVQAIALGATFALDGGTAKTR
jgi:hypothetical protein